MKRNINGHEWKTAIREKKAQAEMARRLRTEERDADRHLHILRANNPGYSLLALLKFVIPNFSSPAVGRLAIKLIERDENISSEDRDFLDEMKVLFARTDPKDCPIIS